MPCRRAFLRPDAGVRSAARTDAGVRVARTDAGVRGAVRMVAGIRRHARVAALLFVLPALAPAALAQEVSVEFTREVGESISSGVLSLPENTGNAVPAQFSVLVDPAPSSDLNVCVRIAETGVDRVAAANEGLKTVTITSGDTFVNYPAIGWANDTDDNRNSEVTLTVVPPSDPACTRTGYTVSGTDGSARFIITDDDPTTVTLAGAAGDIEEGGAKTFTVTLSRGLVSGETLPVPLTFAGEATRNTDYSTACPTSLPNGVTCNNLNTATTPTVTFTGPTSGTTATEVTLTLTATADSTAEGGETVEIDLGTLSTSSGTGLGGGARGADSLAVFSITDPPPTVSLSVSANTVTEGGGALTITATRSEANTSGSALTIPIRVRTTGTTAQGSDYTVGTSISIPNGSSTGTTSFTVADDRIDENTETVVIELGALPAGTVAGSPSFVTISITDNDTAALTFNPASLTVAEGGSATYTVALATQPTGNVTVMVAGASGEVTVDTDPGTNGNQNTLTFTTTNWDTAQTVTVSAGEDDDTANDIATLTHSASGGGYGSVTGNVAVAVTDDDTAALTFSRTALTVTEGGSATYTVRLATLPTGTVTVTVAGASGDVTVDTDTSAPGDQNTLTFTTTTWGTTQTVTVRAGEDNDTANDSATLTHSATGGGYGSVTGSVAVTVTDNDTPGLVLDPTALTVAEGGSATYTVALATLPTGNVTVTVAGASGDVTVDTNSGTLGDQTTLTFDTTNWDTAQTVTVSAGEDDDTANDSATLTHSASGGGYGGVSGSVAVTVTDDDVPTVSLSVSADTVTEGGGGLTITATRSEANTSGSALGIPIRVRAAGTTAQGSDYTVAGSISIPNGSSTGTTRFTAVDDDSDEPSETVVIELGQLPGRDEEGDPSEVTIAIADNDATTVTLAGAAGDIAEGGAKSFTVTLGRGLVSGETLPVELTFAGAATRNTDYTVACPASLGVTCANLDSATTPTVTFTGPNTGMTARTVTLTLTATADSTTETGGETVEIGLGALDADSGTGLGGGARGIDNLVAFSITDPAPTDTTPPGLTIAGVPETIDSTDAFTVTFTFDEAVTEFASDDITVTGGAKGAFAGSGSRYTLVVTPAGGEDVVVTVSAGAASDGPNRGPTAAVSATAAWTAQTPPSTQPSTSPPVVSISAVASPVREGDDAVFTVERSGPTTAALTVLLRVSETTGDGQDFVAADDEGEREVTIPAGSRQARYAVATVNDGVREPDGAVTVSVRAGPAYTGAPSARVVVRDNGDLPTVAITGGGAVTEGADAVFTVTRSGGDAALTVLLRVSEDTGRDFVAASDEGDREVTIPAGARQARYTVATVGDDTEGPDGMVTVAVRADAAYLGAPSARVTVRDAVVDEALLAAWLGRFGRTVAHQALEGVLGRMTAERHPGMQGALAGQGFAPSAHDPESRAHGASRARIADDRFDDRASRGMTGREMLLGSRFTLTGERDGGSLAFWGRASRGAFEGRERRLSLDGAVTTGLLGADYARDDWLAGLALMRSRATGAHAGGAGDGKVAAQLTAAVPYASWRVSERMRLWGAFGHGAGDVEVGDYGADLDWSMAAAGLRGDLLPELALVTDALWTETSSDGTRGFGASEADVTRLRLGLEGRRRFLLKDGSRLTPQLELGARHDGGDAETGFGVELGGGVTWTASALSLDLSGRALLAHDDRDLEDRGMSASVSWDPAPETKRGPSLALGYDQGTEGGLDALFRPLIQASDTLAARSEAEWRMEAAWGFPLSDHRFTGSPHLGLATDAWTLGWRLEPETTALAFGLHVTRRESAEPEHIVGMALDVRW